MWFTQFFTGAFWTEFLQWIIDGLLNLFTYIATGIINLILYVLPNLQIPQEYIDLIRSYMSIIWKINWIFPVSHLFLVIQLTIYTYIIFYITEFVIWIFHFARGK